MGPIREFMYNYPHITLWGIVTLFVLLPLLLTGQAKDRLLELDDMIAEMRALKDRSAELSSEMDDAESRLDDVERRTKVMMEMSGKVNIMTDFFDMLDKDGFWEPIRKEQEYEKRKRGNATINRRIPHLS